MTPHEPNPVEQAENEGMGLPFGGVMPTAGPNVPLDPIVGRLTARVAILETALGVILRRMASSTHSPMDAPECRALIESLGYPAPHGGDE